VAILIAPLAIQDIAPMTRFLILLVCLAILGFSVAFSKRGSIAEEQKVPAGKPVGASK